MGASHDEADISSYVLSEADLRGYPSHGIMRLKYIISGKVNGNLKIPSKPVFKRISPNIGSMYGDHGLGHYVTMRAIYEAIDMCKETGISMVGISNSNHYGMAGIYTETAVRQGLIGIIMSSSDPVVHAVGGIDPVMGTNSLSIGIPNGDSPILLDMATSEASRGKILEAKRRGVKIPVNWAIDKFGETTDNPSDALQGTLNPFGGVKGFGLSIIISILAGPFVGAESGTKVRGTLDLKEACTKGDLIFILDPYVLESKVNFESKVEGFVQEIRNTRKKSGVSEITIPGDGSRKRRATGLKEGYEIQDSTIKELSDTLVSFSMRSPWLEKNE